MKRRRTKSFLVTITCTSFSFTSYIWLSNVERRMYEMNKHNMKGSGVRVLGLGFTV